MAQVVAQPGLHRRGGPFGAEPHRHVVGGTVHRPHVGGVAVAELAGAVAAQH